MHTSDPEKRAVTALSLNTHTQSVPVYVSPPTQDCSVRLRAVNVSVRGAGECWREPSGVEAWQVWDWSVLVSHQPAPSVSQSFKAGARCCRCG